MEDTAGAGPSATPPLYVPAPSTASPAPARRLPSLRHAGELPSALDCFHVVNPARSRLAFLLDYDGTLTPIVDDPDAAILSKEARAVLNDLSQRYPVAIITGRSREKIFRLVGVRRLYYAGSHGFDIVGPRGQRDREEMRASAADAERNHRLPRHSSFIRYHVAESSLPSLRHAAAQLHDVLGLAELTMDGERDGASGPGRQLSSSPPDAAGMAACDLRESSSDHSSIAVAMQPEPTSPQYVDPQLAAEYADMLRRHWDIPGILVEDNHYSLSVHFRKCDPRDVGTIEKLVDSVAYENGLRKTHGKCVFELRPAVKWDKGRAAEWILETIENEEQRHVVPIYIGDDVTDEDALKVVIQRGGFGVIVTDDDERETHATMRLRDTSEVLRFLHNFASTPGEGQVGL
ncbi:hypothetical protein CDCA_CDCA04G1193 [Cyanidium caldarium]|uniref:Trehalose 6-phosphate phosphatase n=1 Tax=Cyanidium caldarium TaxID=2771 RepID=A0AAV9ISD4_CYACA|nr:hypothetical protein CDCA_CDCA04G1193 [Cyanidium caldarium]